MYHSFLIHSSADGHLGCFCVLAIVYSAVMNIGTETSILSRVKQITSPGWMHETSTQGWCTGKTQRDGMGREAGGGIGMGNTCKSMADSCQCMTKTTKIYCKVVSLQRIKINGKKKKKQAPSSRALHNGDRTYREEYERI